MKLNKIFAVMAATAIAGSMAISASAADTTICKISADAEYTVADLPEYEGFSHCWLQNYAKDTVPYTINMVTVEIDGKEYDVTALLPEDEIGGNNSVMLTGNSDKGIDDPAIDVTKISKINYYVTFETDVNNLEVWTGGAIGTNSTTNGWNNIATYGNAFKDDGVTPNTDIMLQDIVISELPTVDSYTALNAGSTETPADTETPTDKNDGDTSTSTGLAGLSLAGLAVAGAAVVASKKKN